MSLLMVVLMAVADEPTSPVVVELDNVCGRDCVAILEKALAKIEGVKSAEMYGDKFHFRLDVFDNKVVLPSEILKVIERIKADSKGEEDFPLISFEATLAGTVGGTTFTARGSGQKYTLKPNDALKALLAAGKVKLTLTGKVSMVNNAPVLDVGEAKETPK